jgi:Na+-transporting methylmalonyl-CoA/oxaloacetate decarboxylase gamma subunit
MNSDLANALLITLLGMGLIFVTIILFWVLLSALVRITSGKGKDQTDVESQRTVPLDDSQDIEREHRRRAALAAVSIALAQQANEGAGDQPKAFPLPPTALVSTWQAVMRARQLGQRGSVR